MGNIQRQCLFVTLLLLIFVHAGSCLKCYQCALQMTTKFELDACKDPFTKMVNVKECSASEVCVKHQKPAKPPVSSEMTIRGCTYDTYCSTQEQDYDYCSTCTSDLCNSAIVTFPSIGLITVFYVVKYYFLG